MNQWMDMVTIQSELVVPRKRNFQILIPNKTQFQFRKLETVFKTVLGQRKPTSLQKTPAIYNAFKDTTCLEFGQFIKARFVCWTGPEKTFTRHIKFKGRQMVHDAKTIIIGYQAFLRG